MCFYILMFVYGIVLVESLNPVIPGCIIVVIAGYLFNLFWYNGLMVFKNTRLLICFILSIFILLIQLLALPLSLDPHPLGNFHF